MKTSSLIVGLVLGLTTLTFFLFSTYTALYSKTNQTIVKRQNIPTNSSYLDKPYIVFPSSSIVTPSNIASSRKYKIFLDWSLHSEIFGSINYKALESIFVTYPNSHVTILLAGESYNYDISISWTEIDSLHLFDIVLLLCSSCSC